MLAGRTWSRVSLLFSIASLTACATGNESTQQTTTSSTSGTGGSSGVGAGGGAALVCGDGVVSPGEACDDGNTADGDGCSATCVLEMGWACQSAPSVCAPVCGDGYAAGGEACDDGNVASGDGCSAKCEVEYGYACAGQPSKCSIVCGDGKIVVGEECDDGNAEGGDGCSASCKVETGFECQGVPSACASLCGDGKIVGGEECDDGNVTGGDGCSSSCKIEPFFSCAGAPSVCTTGCGDGVLVGSEECDDGNPASGDGCSASCKIEPGYACTGQPSVCKASCGDGVVSPGEQCDDGNKTSGDGCSATCKVEPGFQCFGQPSYCLATCGDGIVASTEKCDDGNTTNGDGCSSMCKVEPGYTCTGAPSTCQTHCGDGVVGGAEECDDGNTVSGDGCSSACHTEPGFSCTGTAPTVCSAICGDGLVVGTEQCDDGNTVSGDCCSSACKAEPGCEIEPNDDPTGANDFAALAINGVVKGFIQPQSDLDVYKVTVPNAPGASASITATTLDALGFTCASNAIASYLTLYDDNGFPVVGSSSGGTGKCAKLSAASLAPGDYFVEIRQASSVAPFGYALEIDLDVVVCGDGVLGAGEQCDHGAANGTAGDSCDSACHVVKTPESEPNNTCATANGPYTLFTDPMLLAGSISPAGDADVFAFTLVNYADLRLQTFDASGPGSCASIDTELTLYASSSCSTSLVTNDDGGIGHCSLIDPVASATTRHLAPGTYYAKVFPYSSTATFGYTLVAQLTALCGNGIVEGSEQCDGGPFCKADCTSLPLGNGGIGGGLTGSALPKIAIHGASSSYNADLQAKVQATGLFSTVDQVNINSTTPTLAQLQQYDAVAVFTYLSVTSTYGDNLKAYLESGGGVVLFDYETQESGTYQLKGGYQGTYTLMPLITPSQYVTSAVSFGPGVPGTILDPTSPLLSGITTTVAIPSGAEHMPSSFSPVAGTNVVANWSDGAPAVMWKKINGHTVVELNMFGPSSDATSTHGWSSATQGGRLTANALLFSVPPPVVTVAKAVDLGAQAPSTTSAPQAITYTNGSTSPQTITAVTLTGNNVGDFAVVPSSGLPVTIPPGGTFVVNATFTPSAGGARNATLKATFTGFANPATTLLVGTGI